MWASFWAWRCRAWRAPMWTGTGCSKSVPSSGRSLPTWTDSTIRRCIMTAYCWDEKGTRSEAELHLLKQRLYQGCLSKARRGALTFALPIGYVWDADGAIQFAPDEQVQAVVRHIFAQFEELGTLGGLLRYLARHDI